jgi:hypothetical protein
MPSKTTQQATTNSLQHPPAFCRPSTLDSLDQIYLEAFGLRVGIMGVAETLELRQATTRLTIHNTVCDLLGIKISNGSTICINTGRMALAIACRRRPSLFVL